VSGHHRQDAGVLLKLLTFTTSCGKSQLKEKNHGKMEVPTLWLRVATAHRKEAEEVSELSKS
jgi:hypothetical protein